MTWLVAALRRLRTDRASTLALAIFVFMTAFVFTLGPQLTARVADQALRAEVTSAAAATRNVQLIQERRIGPSAGDPLANVDAAGAELQDRIPPSVGDLFAGRIFTVDTPRWRVTSKVRTQSLATLRFQQGVEDHLRLVEGRLPTGTTVLATDPGSGPNPTAPRIVYEGAISTDTAGRMGVAVGDEVELALDAADPLSRGRFDRAAVRIVGTFEANDDRDPYWSGDTSMAHPTQRALDPRGENVFVNAAVLLSPDAYPALFRVTEEKTLPLRVTWRFYVDPDRLASGRVADVLTDLKRLETAFPASAVGGAQATTLRSGLLGFMQAQQARWAAARAVIAVVSVGPAVVASAALVLLAILSSRRRRETLSLSRSRGASSRQAALSVIFEGLLLTVPLAVLAALLVATLVGVPLGPGGLVIPMAVAAGATMLLVIVVGPTVFGPPGATERSVSRTRRSSPRRLAIEALVVGLALGGAWLLRQRGIGGSGAPGGPEGGDDPFIAAVPALVGVAVGLVALRLLPIPLGAMSRLAASRRELVPVLALRRASRGTSAAPVLLVLLATATMGAFSLATLAHLDRAAEAVAWQATGAAFRLAPGDRALPRDLDPSGWPGVEAAVPVFQTTTRSATGRAATLLAVDLSAYVGVVAGTPLETALPDPGTLAPAAGAGATGPASGSVATAPIPAIVSPAAEGDPPVAVGDLVELVVDGRTTTVRVAAVAPTFPTLTVGEPFVVVDRAALQATRRDAALPASAWLIRAPDDQAAGLGASVAADATGATLERQTERAVALRDAPAVVAVTTGVAVAGLIAAAYAALAVAVALALAGAARASEDAHLRTLGMAGRDEVGLMVIEHGPTVLIAFAAGAALGLGLFVALRPGLGLAAVVGSALEVPLGVAAGQLAVLLLAMLAVVAVGMAIGLLLERGTVAASAIRRGIE